MLYVTPCSAIWWDKRYFWMNQPEESWIPTGLGLRKSLVSRNPTLELQMGSEKRVVHINRVRPLLIGDVDRFSSCGRWSPPLFNHYESSVPAHDPQDGGNSTGRLHAVIRSRWIVRHPDYYGMSGDT